MTLSSDAKLYTPVDGSNRLFILVEPSNEVYRWVIGPAPASSGLYNGKKHSLSDYVLELFQGSNWIEYPFIYTTKEAFILHLSLATGSDLSGLTFWEGLFKDD